MHYFKPHQNLKKQPNSIVSLLFLTSTLLLLFLSFSLTGCRQDANQRPETAESPIIPSLTLTSVPTDTPIPEVFNSERAFSDVAYQLSLGARTVGSPAHEKVGDWIIAELNKAGWQVETQNSTFQGKPIRNIVGKLTLSSKASPWVILGAHYDSRLLADHDPDIQKRTQPVLGANDGASGVAVLLELARTIPGQLEAVGTGTAIPSNMPHAGSIWLLFIDNEDNGNIPGWDWLMGSRAFVNNLNQKPDAVIIIDMIGDKDLNIKYETNSNPIMNQEIWSQAAKLGYSQEFLERPGFSMIDDHTPFLEAGIPAVDLIDFDYPYYHTTADTIDKINAHSLKVIGDTLTAWLLNGSAIFKTSRP